MATRFKYDSSTFSNSIEARFFQAWGISSAAYATQCFWRGVGNNPGQELAARTRAIISFDRALNGESVNYSKNSNA